MRTILACLALLLLSACAVGNTHDYATVMPYPKVKGSSSVAVAVQDERSYILNHNKKESFSGLYRGGFGNPFDVMTSSGNPLSTDWRNTIVAALKAKGFAAEPVETALGLSQDDATKALVAQGKDHALLFVITEWKSDTMMNTALHYNVTLTVFDKAGAAVAETNFSRKDDLGPAVLPKDARLAVAQAYRETLETLLNDPKVIEALQQ
ncbi:MAG: hypothetical protein ACREFM_02710 [Hypericibacter sp.]